MRYLALGLLLLAACQSEPESGNHAEAQELPAPPATIQPASFTYPRNVDSVAQFLLALKGDWQVTPAQGYDKPREADLTLAVELEVVDAKTAQDRGLPIGHLYLYGSQSGPVALPILAEQVDYRNQLILLTTRVASDEGTQADYMQVAVSPGGNLVCTQGRQTPAGYNQLSRHLYQKQ